jgi:hypothetical protein
LALAEERYRFAVRKGDAALLEEVNLTLQALGTSGEAKAILDRWFRRPPAEAASAAAPPAIGAVTRIASTPGRFVVLTFKGLFRAGADVSVLDPQGAPLGKGKVSSIYEDEVYVDGADLPAGIPQVGFPVAMNYPPDDARTFLAARGDLFSNVKAAARREADQRSKEAGDQFERDRRERDRYQEDMTKTKQYLDYQYSDEYYRSFWPAWP